MHAANIAWLGLVPFTIIIGSLSLMILSAILIKPRRSKITLVFIGTILTLYTAFVSFFLIVGAFFSIFVP